MAEPTTPKWYDLIFTGVDKYTKIVEAQNGGGRNVTPQVITLPPTPTSPTESLRPVYVPTPPAKSDADKEDGKMSTGAIIGIVVVGLLVVSAVIYFATKGKK